MITLTFARIKFFYVWFLGIRVALCPFFLFDIVQHRSSELLAIHRNTHVRRFGTF